ncbi:hypothetical protein AAE478_003497 [Parahypoxylon ruwenzoriense]
MSHPPSTTPVKVPTSAASYTPATLDPDLRSQINMLLIQEGYITKIQEHLLHSLNSHPSNWPSAVQSHALSLLRTGDVTTFPALVRRVLEDVRQETAATTAASSSTSDNAANGSEAVNGTTNGNGAKAGGGGSSGSVNGTAAAGSNNNNNNSNAVVSDGSLAIPAAVVEAVLKVTRECLETVCEIDDGSAAG